MAVLMCRYSFILLLVSLSAQVQAQIQTQNPARLSLLQDIKHAQQRLSKLESDIAIEAQGFSAKIRERQNEVLALREKAAVKRRLIDDQTLGLSKIQSRLQQWQQQESYQKNLLLQVAERHHASPEQIAAISSDLQAGLPFLVELAETQNKKLAPQWQADRVLQSNGQYQSAKTLTVGPVTWFLIPEKQQGGLLDKDKNVLLSFGSEQQKELQALFERGQGNVMFDPTLGTAVKLEKQQESPLQHLLRGGLWVVPIVLFGLFALGIGFFKSWQLFRLPSLQPMLAERIELMHSSADVNKQLEKLLPHLKGAQKHLFDITLASDCGEQRDDKLLAFLLEYRQKLQSNLGAIAVTASVAPLLGLLGTVSGMIETFNMMSLFGTGDPSVVSGGISKALITTELGLVVAIPALVIHSLLSRFIRNHNTQLDATAIRLGKLPSETTVNDQILGEAA